VHEQGNTLFCKINGLPLRSLRFTGAQCTECEPHGSDSRRHIEAAIQVITRKNKGHKQYSFFLKFINIRL
jgi:hypothetical protein